MQNILDRLADGPGLYLKTIDLDGQAAILVDMDADSYAASAYLDNRIQMASPFEQSANLRDLFQAGVAFAERPDPLRFIFHIGNAGAQLLSRLLGATPGGLALREPEPLQIVASLVRERLGQFPDPDDVQLINAVFGASMGLLARPMEPNGPVIVTLQSTANVLMRQVLGFKPGNKAICMLQSLPQFLTEATKPEAEEEIRYNFDGLYRHEMAELVGQSVDGAGLFRQAAAIWCVNMMDYHATGGDPAVGRRLLPVQLDHFLAQPDVAFRTILNHLDIPLDDAAMKAILADQAHYDDAATNGPESYDIETRAQEAKQAEADHGDKILDAMRWIDEFAKQNPVMARLREGGVG